MEQFVWLFFSGEAVIKIGILGNYDSVFRQRQTVISASAVSFPSGSSLV
jgi:hypothetical protein